MPGDGSRDRVRLEKIKNKLECLRQIRYIHEKSVKRQMKRLHHIKTRINFLGNYRDSSGRRVPRDQTPGPKARVNHVKNKPDPCDKRRSEKMMQKLLNKKRRPKRRHRSRKH